MVSPRPRERFERHLGLVGVTYFFVTPLGLVLLWVLLYRKGDPFPWDFVAITLLTILPTLAVAFLLP